MQQSSLETIINIEEGDGEKQYVFKINTKQLTYNILQHTPHDTDVIDIVEQVASFTLTEKELNAISPKDIIFVLNDRARMLNKFEKSGYDTAVLSSFFQRSRTHNKRKTTIDFFSA